MYIELHCHSAFSFLDGASLPEHLALQAQSLGYPALALSDLADSQGLSVVATGNVHYHERRLHRLHDVLAAIRHRSTLDGSHAVRRANSEFFLRPPGEVALWFRDRPDAVANTGLIADR